MNDVEIWKTYPEIYFIQGSNLGNIRTLDHYVKQGNSKRLCKGRLLPQHSNKNGYISVVVSVNGKLIHLLVHRVIASCFLQNPDGLEQVNHIDCDHTNNHVSNLEWCSREYNYNYRDKFGYGANCGLGRMPIIAINLTTLEVLRFTSQMEAARQLGVYQQNVNSVIKVRLNKTGGYWFTNADSRAVETVRDKFDGKVAREVEKLLNEED